MSAPEPQVYAETRYVGVCPHCPYYRTLNYSTTLDAEEDLRHHMDDCPALAFARLQADRDARDPEDGMTWDEAMDGYMKALAEMRRDPHAELVQRLRALVAKWRERTVTVMPSTLTAADTERLTWGAAADELERAIGGGRG